MIALMARALLAWRDDPLVSVVIIDHAEGAAFARAAM
jgi:enoyl-CoA hydratase/carnithine racemase